MNDQKKVLCIITTLLKEPYPTILKEGQEKTWLSGQLPERMEVVIVHGNYPGRITTWLDNCRELIRLKHGYTSKFLSLVENFISKPLLSYIPKISKSEILRCKSSALHVNFPDMYVTLRWKILAMFSYFINQTNSDYLFITTNSSYIRTEELIKFMDNLPINNVYCGAYAWNQAKFVSGSNRIFSRDVAEKILDNMSLWKPGEIEDVEIANVLKQLGINHTGKNLISISSNEELLKISDETLFENYHFRLKSGPLRSRFDTSLMQALHAKLTK